MQPVQYELFRELDRRCVSEDLAPARCAEVVEHKRRLIDNALNRSNPLVADVLAGRTTFVAAYDGFSRAFRGLRRFVPKSHDAAWNERLDQLAQIVPNVRHFRRRSWLAADNPVNLTLYGTVAGFAVGVLLSFAGSGGAEPGDAVARLWSRGQFYLELGMAGVGFLFGVAAMFKYRTRHYDQIHAREAAGYMDANYDYFRRTDAAGWAEHLKSAAGQAGTRPD